MTRILLALFAITASYQLNAQIEKTINVPITTSSSPTDQALLYLPSDYTTSTNSYPLLVFCHSASEAADGASTGTGLAKIYNQASYGGPSYFIEHGGWPASFKNPVTGAQEQFIVVSPQAKTWSLSGDQLANVINYLVATYRVDINRIHVTGVSAGGAGVAEYCAQLNVNESTPSLTADVRKWKPADMVPMSEATNDPTQTWANIVVADSIYFWGFGDINGDLYGGFTYDFYNFINKAKSGFARFTSFSTGHGPWNPFYNPTRTETFTWKNANSSYSIYNWMLANSRAPAAPAANAGSPQTVTLPTSQATLNGSGSTGTITSYSWTQLSGPSTAGITSPTSVSTTVTGLLQGTYIFQVTINGKSNSTVQISVVPAPPPPVANAGAAQNITLPTSQVTLSGSTSTGTITSYNWTELSGPSTAVLATPTTVSTKVTGLAVGVYVFQLTLNGGSTAKVSVTVNPQPVVVNAGNAQTISPPVNQVTLSGSSSTGTITSYLWTQVSGPSIGNIVTPAAVTTSVTGLVPGVYVFQLTLNGTSSSTVRITVNTIPPPVAKAGAAQKITLPTNLVTLNGSSSTGIIAFYSWTQLLGPQTDFIATPMSAVTQVTGLVAGNYTFQLRVIDTASNMSTSTVDVTVLSNTSYASPLATAANPSQSVTLPADPVNETVNYTLKGASLQGIKWSKFKTPNQTAKTVVFLGSSTTAGTGATTEDSSFVGRFTTYYTKQGMIKTAVNLGVSGYNPYNAMPTGYVAPASVVTALGASVAAVDPTANVTKALSYNPDIIVINFPTNGYDVLSTSDIMNGLQLLYNYSSANGADVYISTTQPREDFTSSIQSLLQVLRDSILIRFGSHALNFYDAVAVPGTTKRLYPYSGDNIHLNNTGHLQLFNVVQATNVFQNKISSASIISNPTSATASISGLVAGTHLFQGSVTDTHGQSVSVVTTLNVVQGTIPVANAGSNQTITLPTSQVSLSSAASTGTISTYSWTQVSGPVPANIVSPTGATTIVNGLTEGVFVFQLSLNGGSTSNVQITVLPVPPLVANAGPDQTISLPASQVTLDGTHSTGLIDTYSWTEISGPVPANIVSPTGATTIASGLTEGVYVFQLTLNGISTSTMQVTVITPPLVANAGSAQTVTLPLTQATLNGTGSTGIIDTYSWSQISGPNTANIISSDGATTIVNGLVQGVYVFQLTLNGTNSAIVQVTVVQPPPVANAGTSQTVLLPASQVTLDGSASSGINISDMWTEVSGPSTAVIAYDTAIVTVTSNLVQGVYIFKLTITDDQNTVATDTMIVTVNNPVTTKMINVNIYGGTNPYANMQWNNWNVNPSVNSPTLLYADGTSTGVIATLSINEGVVDNSATYGGTMAPAAVLRYSSFGETNRTLSFTGLKSNLTYNIELYASRNSNSGQKTVFQITGKTPDTVLSYNNLTNKAVFTGVKSTAQGALTITISTPTGYSYLNGFAITEITGGTTTNGGPDAIVSGMETLEASSLDTTLINTADIAFYPNPVQDQFTLAMNNSYTGTMKVTLVDASGVRRKSFEFVKNQQVSNNIIPMSNLPAGVYVVTVQIGNWRTVHKILKL